MAVSGGKFEDETRLILLVVNSNAIQPMKKLIQIIEL